MKRTLMIALALAGALLLAGCEATEAETATAKARTVSSFQNPELIARLPDGRSVYRSVVVDPQRDYLSHYVYYVDCATTTNRQVSHGKSTIITTTVDLTNCVNGVPSVEKEIVQ